MELLQNQEFQFLVLTIISVLAILVAYIIYKKQKQQRQISYRILTNTSLLSVKDGIKGDVEIVYKGKPVKEVQLLIIRILCSGTIPIKPDDYIKPITINMATTTRVLSAKIIKKNPEDLEIEIGIEQNKIVIEPVLLNPRESFTVKILVDKINPEIKIKGRWAGVKILNQLTNEAKNENIIFWSALVIIALGVVSGYLGEFFSYFNRTDIIPMSLIILGFGLFIAYIFWMRRKDKLLKKELELLKSETY